MLKVNDAIEKVLAFVESLYGSNLRRIAVEEVDFSAEEDYWLITLGWDEPHNATGNAFEQVMSPTFTRVYKVFYVDVRDGEVMKMKIRE